jgi:hypothetical protein
VIAHPSGLSSNNEVSRVIAAAQSPHWSIGIDRRGEIMATRDTGDVGRPWVVVAERSGRGRRVSCYAPGDDVEREGEIIGELSGNPREMGRQLRSLLELTAARHPLEPPPSAAG